jgi:CheY-like chemotaxis protein
MAGARSILIVEDEPLIAMMLEDFLKELGHIVVGIADSRESALSQVEQGGIDLVILDVHLRGGTTSWPVADVLADRGIPFLLSTGGSVGPTPPRHAGAPQLDKPFTIEGVRAALADVALGQA